MGKITPGFKTILVFITFLGFTNFILSETKINFSEMVLNTISANDLLSDNLSSADSAPMEMEEKKYSIPVEIKSSEANSSSPTITNITITHATCVEKNDGVITISVSGGTTPYSFGWSGENGYTSNEINLTNIEAGAYNVTVTDNNGASTSESNIKVLVQDNIFPQITAPGNVTANTNSGSCEATGIDLGNPIVSDNCNNYIVENDAPVSFPEGQTTVTWTISDASGNVGTASQTITVTDNENPVITHNGDQDVNSDTGICGAALTVSATANDNCSVGDPTGTRGDGQALTAAYPVGTTTITWNVTDANGNEATPVVQTIVVTDNEKPVITHNGDQNVNSDTGTCGAAITVNASATDNCSVGDPTGTRSDGQALTAAYPVGTTTITWNVTDANGNEATPVVQTIVVTDNEKPVITHNGDQNVNSDTGTCGAAITVNASATDNCSVGDPTGTRSDGQALTAAYPVGTTTITWNVTDANGNEAAPVVQTIVVTDNENPVITHNGDQDVNSDTGICGAALTVSATANDNCSVGDPTGTRSDGEALTEDFPVGTTTITWNVTDANGNDATPVVQTIVVTDNEKPVITHNGDQNVNSDAGTCGAVVTINATSTDNCSAGNPTGTRSDGQALTEAYPVGTTTITWNVTDANGNEATPVVQTIVVTDIEKPVITHNGDQNVNSDTGTCGAAVTVNASATDNCSVGDPTGTRSDGQASTEVYPVGTTTITWNVTDANGNEATPVVQTIVVTDNEKPVITHNGDQNVNSDTGTCGAALTISATANDNCSVGDPTGTRSDGQALTEVYLVGTTTITWNVTDANGNEATPVIQTIVITDIEKPTINAPAAVSVTTDNNACIASGISLGTPQTADNCGVKSVTNDAPSTFPLGTTTVTWTVIDNSDNTKTATQIVTVEDNQKPTASNPSPINVQCLADVPDPDITIVTDEADNCTSNPVVAFVSDSSDGNFNPEIITRTYSVTDETGNSINVIQKITIKDTQAPAIPNLPDLTAECPLTVTPPTTTDNCDGEITGETGITNLTFYESDTIYWTFTDAAGNSTGPVAQNIIITDTTAPVPDVATLPKKTITGCQISSIDELDIPTATDACEGIIYGTLGDDFQFPYLFYGTRSIEWSFIDNNGNTSIQTQEIELIEANINGGSISGTYLNTAFNSVIDISSCADAITVDLKLAGEIGSIIQWEKLAVNEGVWRTISNTATSHQVYFAPGALESTYYRVLIQVGTCTKYSDSFYIRALPPGAPPTVQNVDGDDMKYCLGDEVRLVATSNFLVTEDAMPNSSGDFDQGQLNTQDPDGWLVDGNPGDFTAGGNARKARNWSGTNDHKFGDIRYDSRDKKFTIAYGNYYEVDNKGKPVYEDKIPTTLESPIMDLSNTESASLDFDQAFNFATNDLAIIEISIDGGVTYQTLRVMHAQGDPVRTWFTAGTAESVAGSNATNYNFDTDNTSISLAAYLGQSRVRIKWSFIGTTDKSVWAMDNIKINKKILIDTELEWTEGIGNPSEEPIAQGSTEVPINFIPDTPGVHEYGGTALVNGCRTYSEEGTGLIVIPVTSSYAGEDIIYTSAECGRNIIQLNAYDNTKTANENIDKGAFSIPPSGCKKCDAPGTGDIGTWSWAGASPSCTEVSFSNINDPDAIFTSGPGTYTLTWTVNGCSSNMVVTITDCDKVDFDGIDDHVDFKNNYNLNGDFSIEVWVKPESVSGNRTIFSKRGNSTSNGYDLKIKDGVVSFNWNSSGTINSAPHVINTNRWYHIALTHTAAGAYRLYIDGIPLPTTSVGGGSPGPNDNSAIMGAVNITTNDLPINYYNGWMEELRVWGEALNPEQIRMMMNQRITKADNNKIVGEVIPLNIPDLAWNNLIGYYRMDDIGCGNLYPYNDGGNYVGFEGKLINITTPQEKTAPLPYTTDKDNFLWTDEGEAGPWTHWDVWDMPNANGVNGQPIEWNIVKTSNYVESGNKNIKVLGLIIEENELDILNPHDSHDELNSGHSMEVTHYLEIDGVLDLTGESQLLQPTGSIIGNSSGYLERDQQGTANSYNYNYWSSPVSSAVGNVPYTIGGVMRDGTNSATPKILNFGPPNIHEFADFPYDATNGKRVSSYWLNTFHGEENEYGDWHRVTKDDPIKVGEGYTMKGTLGTAAISDPQNYTFKGIPNNGDIEGLNISEEQSYLIGNPYPSALDANEFILDNLGSRNNGKNIFNGSLYFWSHFEGGDTHILKEYIGGYAVYNLGGGIRAFANDERIDHTSYQGQGGKEPQRYIPVGQSFFINSVSVSEYSGNNVNTNNNPPTIHGGNIHFKNSQRVFQREEETHSVFHRPEIKYPNKSEGTRDHTETRQKIWLKFYSPLGYHREILVTADSIATDGFDLGYDAPMIEYNIEDMFWLLGSTELVIQGIPDFNAQRVIPIGLVVDKKENFTIKIEKLLNFEGKTPIYLKDKLNDSIHNLRTSEYVAISEPGYIDERFELIFYKEKPSPPIVELPVVDPDEMMKEYGISLRHGQTDRELQILNPNEHSITNMYIFDLNSNKLEGHNNLPGGKEFRMPVRNYSSGVYIVQLVVEGKIVSKKIIINN